MTMTEEAPVATNPTPAPVQPGPVKDFPGDKMTVKHNSSGISIFYGDRRIGKAFAKTDGTYRLVDDKKKAMGVNAASLDHAKGELFELATTNGLIEKIDSGEVRSRTGGGKGEKKPRVKGGKKNSALVKMMSNVEGAMDKINIALKELTEGTTLASRERRVGTAVTALREALEVLTTKDEEPEAPVAPTATIVELSVAAPEDYEDPSDDEEDESDSEEDDDEEYEEGPEEYEDEEEDEDEEF